MIVAALAALDTLKPADITLVKSMKNPPKVGIQYFILIFNNISIKYFPIKVIKTVMAAVCVMKDIKPEKILDPDGSGKKVINPKVVIQLCKLCSKLNTRI